MRVMCGSSLSFGGGIDALFEAGGGPAPSQAGRRQAGDAPLSHTGVPIDAAAVAAKALAHPYAAAHLPKQLKCADALAATVGHQRQLAYSQMQQAHAGSCRHMQAPF